MGGTKLEGKIQLIQITLPILTELCKEKDPGVNSLIRWTGKLLGVVRVPRNKAKGPLYQPPAAILPLWSLSTEPCDRTRSLICTGFRSISITKYQQQFIIWKLTIQKGSCWGGWNSFVVSISDALLTYSEPHIYWFLPHKYNKNSNNLPF